MNITNGSVGVIDSGVGGLTVAKELQKILPNENITYFGDSINCPYGNKSKEEIFRLTSQMVDFLREKGIKCLVIACNTISTIVTDIRKKYDFPVISIVEAGAEKAAGTDFDSIGVIATCFTAKSGAYAANIKKLSPEKTVIEQGSENLAGLIDSGNLDGKEVNDEINLCVGKIMDKSKIGALILGCTHFPIVMNKFAECYPSLALINPAESQVLKLKEILKEKGELNTDGGHFELYTTGSTDNYEKIMERLGMIKPSVIKTVTL